MNYLSYKKILPYIISIYLSYLPYLSLQASVEKNCLHSHYDLFFSPFPIIFLFTYIWKKIQYFDYSYNRNMVKGILITSSCRKSCSFTESYPKDAYVKASGLHIRFYTFLCIVLVCMHHCLELVVAEAERMCVHCQDTAWSSVPIEKQCMQCRIIFKWMVSK